MANDKKFIEMRITNVRGHFVNIHQDHPGTNDRGEDYAWGMTLLLEPTDDQVKALKKAEMQIIAHERGKEAAQKVINARKSNQKIKFADCPIKNYGKNTDSDTAHWEELKDYMTLKVSNKKKKPGIILDNGEEPTKGELEKYCYWGAYFNVSIFACSYPAGDGYHAGVKFYLKSAMLLPDMEGKRLDNQTSAKEDFADLIDTSKTYGGSSKGDFSDFDEFDDGEDGGTDFDEFDDDIGF